MKDEVKAVPVDMSPQYVATEDALSTARYLLFKTGLVNRGFVSPSPTGTAEYSMTLVADLLDAKRKSVGSVRVNVLVPVAGNSIKYIIEWTRDIFGFWYRQVVVVPDGVSDPIAKSVPKLKQAFESVRWTAQGVTKVASMNRMFKKVKKNRTADRTVRAGMRMW